MVSILLTVLKIIGIIILVILGLILFLLLLILFVPVRYYGNGSYQEDFFAAKLRASWLLHLISVRGELQKEQALHIYMKIFGITVYDNLKADDTKTRHKKSKSTKNKTESTGEIQAASAEEPYSEGVTDEEVPSEHNVLEENGIEYSTPIEKKQNEHLAEHTRIDTVEGNDGSNRKKIRIVQKIKIILIKFVNFFKNIKFTFNKVCDTMVRIKNNIEYYLKVLQLDSTKRAFAACQKQLKYVLKKILPRKYRINLHLGFDDPAVMGEILAVWGMFYPFHLGNIDIQPEFEQAVVKGDFSFQGHVSVNAFVQVACILFFDKDIRRLIRHLKHNEN